jgi:hypothetical protein
MAPKGLGRIKLANNGVHWLTVVIKKMNNHIQ